MGVAEDGKLITTTDRVAGAQPFGAEPVENGHLVIYRNNESSTPIGCYMEYGMAVWNHARDKTSKHTHIAHAQHSSTLGLVLAHEGTTFQAPSFCLPVERVIPKHSRCTYHVESLALKLNHMALTVMVACRYSFDEVGDTGTYTHREHTQTHTQTQTHTHTHTQTHRHTKTHRHTDAASVRIRWSRGQSRELHITRGSHLQSGANPRVHMLDPCQRACKRRQLIGVQ